MIFSHLYAFFCHGRTSLYLPNPFPDTRRQLKIASYLRKYTDVVYSIITIFQNVIPLKLYYSYIS